MKYIFQFLMVLIGGETAPIGYLLGIGFSAVGFILLTNLEKANYLILGIILSIFGLFILFVRIRKDVVEFRENHK